MMKNKRLLAAVCLSALLLTLCAGCGGETAETEPDTTPAAAEEVKIETPPAEEAPKEIEKPEPPKEIEKPEPPKDGEKPDFPKDGEKPPFPKGGEKPDLPKDGEKPDFPKDGEKPKPPTDGEKPPFPKDGEKPDFPKDGEKPEKPNDVEKPEMPSDGEPNMEKPNADISPAEPVPPPDEPIPPGGTTEYYDPDAAKTIGSDEITSFLCTVSLLTVELPEGSALQPPRYEFRAERTESGVNCSCESAAGSREFTADGAFLEKLQSIVKTHELAQYNGIYSETHGLPDDFGATLRVEYASGERISAFRNNDMYLPLAAVEELAQLFGE